ncbi:MAG: glycosyltransferase family 25 protein [Akkermansiaceae bacterium]
MHHLLKHFDRIVVISLPDRSDRREKLLANLTACGLATEDDITWFDAVDGRVENIPSWWETGPGAWGCRFSQLNVIQQAQRDGLESVLIIEDDAVFHPRAGEWLDATMPLLPADWGQFFLGGQHMKSPIATGHPMLVRANGTTRTHAYAVNQRAYQLIIDQVANDEEYKKRPGWHVDHQFGYCQINGYWKAYAPTWWMAGQDEGESNIVRSNFGRRWWQEGKHYWKLPFVSHNLRPEEVGSYLYLPEMPTPQNEGELALWLRRAARSAWQLGKLPAYDSRVVSCEAVSRLWPSGIREIHSQQELAELADYPANGLFPHPFFNSLALI